MKAFIKVYFLFFSCFLVVSCKEAVEHTAGAIRERDSVAVMTTLGVNTLISDSGITKYRIVAERDGSLIRDFSLNNLMKSSMYRPIYSVIQPTIMTS